MAMPIPIPDGVDVRPCEYVVTDSTLCPGRPCVNALVAFDADERERIAAGFPVWLSLDGGELPWAITVASRA